MLQPFHIQWWISRATLAPPPPPSSLPQSKKAFMKNDNNNNNNNNNNRKENENNGGMNRRNVAGTAAVTGRNFSDNPPELELLPHRGRSFRLEILTIFIPYSQTILFFCFFCSVSLLLFCFNDLNWPVHARAVCRTNCELKRRPPRRESIQSHWEPASFLMVQLPFVTSLLTCTSGLITKTTRMFLAFYFIIFMLRFFGGFRRFTPPAARLTTRRFQTKRPEKRKMYRTKMFNLLKHLLAWS